MDEKPKTSLANLALVGFAAGIVTVLLVLYLT